MILQNKNAVIYGAGEVDIPVVQNIPLTEISLEDYVKPIMLTARTRFLTAKATAKVMMEQRSGVILSISATPGGIGYPYTGSFAAANTAVFLASDLAASITGVTVDVTSGTTAALNYRVKRQ